MNQITSCPQCRQTVQIPDSLMGKQVKCPLCATPFRASPPGEYSAAPLTPAPAPYSPPYSGPSDPYGEGTEPYSSAPGMRRPIFREPDPYEDRYGGRRHLEPHRGSTVLTLGILGLVVCGILGIIAWGMGSTDLAKMRQGRMDPEGEGITRAGQICGIIATVFLIIGVIFGVIFLMAVAAAVPRGGGRF